LPLEFFSQALMTLSKNSLASPSRDVIPKKFKLKTSQFLESKLEDLPHLLRVRIAL